MNSAFAERAFNSKQSNYISYHSCTSEITSGYIVNEAIFHHLQGSHGGPTPAACE